MDSDQFNTLKRVLVHFGELALDLSRPGMFGDQPVTPAAQEGLRQAFAELSSSANLEHLEGKSFCSNWLAEKNPQDETQVVCAEFLAQATQVITQANAQIAAGRFDEYLAQVQTHFAVADANATSATTSLIRRASGTRPE